MNYVDYIDECKLSFDSGKPFISIDEFVRSKSIVVGFDTEDSEYDDEEDEVEKPIMVGLGGLSRKDPKLVKIGTAEKPIMIGTRGPVSDPKVVKIGTAGKPISIGTRGPVSDPKDKRKEKGSDKDDSKYVVFF